MIGRAVVFLLAALYFAAFRHYGFQLEDEGTILSHFARVAAGERPYLDFFTVYTPGFYATGAAVLTAVGNDVGALRAVLTLLHASTAVGLYELALPAAGPVLATLAPLAWAALLPVYVGEFASFNVPYPAWGAGALWVGLALVLRTWTRTGKVGWLAAAGVIAAVTASVKLNAGAHQLVAAAIVVAATTRRGDGTTSSLSRFVLAAAALGVVATLGSAVMALDGIVLLLPAALLVVAAHRHPFRPPPLRSGRAELAWAALFGGFAAAAAVWVVPWLVRLGPTAFGTTILLLGSNTLGLYRVPYPAPNRFTALVLVGVAAASLAGTYRRRRGSAVPNPTVLGVAIGVPLVVTLVAYARDPLLPEGLAWTLRLWLEAALPWLIPVTHVVAVVAVSRADEGGETRRSELFCLAAVAIAMYWQVFPRSDSMHVILAMALSLALIVTAVGRGLARQGGVPTFRAVSGLAVGVLVAAALMAPGLRSALSCEASTVGSSRLALCLEPRAADDLTDLRAAADYVRASTDPGARVLGFPALGGLLFAAERASPVRHDYWFPGAPDREEERAMVTALARDPPPVVVAANDLLWVFDGAPRYFATLRAFVLERYRLAARYGRYDVFARRDRSLAAPPAPPSRPAGSLAEVMSSVAAYRRQAIRRWLAPDPGVDRSVPPLPTDRRDALLLLRAVRDGGDARAVGWILAGLAAADARVRADAVAWGGELARRMEAARYRWAADVPAEPLRQALERHRGDAERLTHADAEQLRALGDAILAYLGAPEDPAPSTSPPSGKIR